MRCLSLVAVCACVALSGCTITGLEETATRQAWPSDAEDAFGCTPLSLDFFGGGIRGSGSGVFVSDRWLLTAAHVVPDGAQYVSIWTGSSLSPSGVVMPIELVITGGGEPVEAGDWALVRVPAKVKQLGARTARLVDATDEHGALLVGFPTIDGDMAELFAPRQMVVLASESPATLDFFTDVGELRYFRMVHGWTALGGASGGPVVVRDGRGRPGVGGLVLGRVEYRGLWRRGRAIVTHAMPPQAWLAAAGALDGLPSRTGHDAVLVWDEADELERPTLSGDGNGVSQRRAASGR